MGIDKCLMKRLKRVYGSLTQSLIERIMKPSRRLYIRTNTFYISPGDLRDLLRSKGLEVKQEPYIKEALYFELKGPNKIPLLDKRIYVDRFAAESIMIGADLYAPGVRMYDDFDKGEEITVIAPNNKPIAVVKTTISSDKLKYMRKGLVGKNILSVYKAPPIRSLEEYEKGLFYPQSIPAMITSHVLDPKPGELIADMNSAPGGKTSHMVQLSSGMARIFAFERNKRKAQQVADTLFRLRLYFNTIIIPQDSRYVHIDLGLVNAFDKVLIDPPCTGLGVRPKIIINKTCRDLHNSFMYQRQFFNAAKHILKENGLLIYSTCTLTLEENEENIKYAVERLGFEPVDIGWIPYADKVYYYNIVGYRFTPLNNDMPGYFIAILKKR